MPTGPERVSSNSEIEGCSRRDRGSTSGRPTARTTLTRRQALAGIGSVSLGLSAGCLNSVRTLMGNRIPVEAEEPAGWDDEQGTVVTDTDEYTATPGEFRFLLEENGIVVDELYRDPEENDLILFYESEAETTAESDEEIALIYRIFRDGLITRGADVNILYTEIVPESRFDGQIGGWSVNSQWAEQHAAGESSDLEVWNAIVNTKVAEEGEGPQGAANETETSEEPAAEHNGTETADGTDPDSSSTSESETDGERNETTDEDEE